MRAKTNKPGRLRASRIINGISHRRPIRILNRMWTRGIAVDFERAQYARLTGLIS